MSRRITLNSRTWKVDSNVPVHDPIFGPEKSRGRKREYPFDQLKIGESVVIDSKKHRDVKTAAYRYNYVARLIGKQKSRLLLRKQPDGTTRVWRVPMRFVCKAV